VALAPSRTGSLLAVAVVAVGALLSIALWLGRDAPATSAGAAPPEQASVERPDTPLTSAGAGPASVSAAAPPEQRVEASADRPREAAPATASAACTVRGVVVDEDERPLAGVAVRLAGYGGWADRHDVPLLAVGIERHGWESATDAAGAFRFDVPVPTVVTTVLAIEPDALHERAEVAFSDAVDFAQPALRAGDRDLGVFRLAVSGAIRGTVRAADGLPIAGAELDVGTEPWNSIGVGAVSDARGEYLVPHVPAGSWCLKVKAHGFLPAHAKPIAVERGLVAQGPDLALERAPTLRGRVTDGAGGPIAGARVAAHAVPNGATASARSAADGAFTLYLRSAGPSAIEVEAEGWQPFGIGETDVYEPGADGIEIALLPDVMTRFFVVDEASAPIERFGLRIHRNEGMRAAVRPKGTVIDPPAPRDRPGGVLAVGARPGLDRFELYAPGFEALFGEIEHDADAPGTQTLRPSRGTSLAGRVVAGGAPVAGAALALTPVFARTDTTDDGREVRRFDEDRQLRAVVETGADGRFAFPGLDRGDAYALSASHPEKGVLRLVPVHPAARGENDLGDLELVAAGAIAGELLLPPGIASGGRTIFLGDGRQRVTATTDAGGRFRFDGVAPGEQALFVDDAPGILAAGAPFAVTVAAGATADVVLDCRGRAVAEVALRVDLGGVSPEGYRVDLRPSGAGGEAGTLYKLGEMDAEGRVRGFVRAGGEAEVLVNVWGYATLVHPTERVPLPVGAQPERTVAFELGGLELALPDGVAIPARGALVVEVEGRQYRVRIDAGVEPSRGAEVLDGGRRFRLHLLPPGVHDVRVLLVDLAAADVQVVATADGGFTAVRPAAYEGAVSAAIAAGEIAFRALP
jgi:protocatechuate 3,4-dioxygenase beta subunit